MPQKNTPSRATRWLTWALACTSLWLIAWLQLVPLPEASMEFLPAIPLWCFITFCSYSLGKIGIDLLTFRDCPEAYTSLLKVMNSFWTPFLPMFP
ncbi:hypothetical protein HMI54_013744 [Coelomomyces lativittatus]|nr:hypothetical protein HMI54_013744 [Coelomomyces lativittatus]